MAIRILRDFRPHLGPARNQGGRPTCIAFAISDAHAAARGPYEALSVEHLYYHAVRRTPDQDPHSGVNMPTALAALAVDGQSLEIGWPYADPFRDVPDWSPPSTATPVYRRASSSFGLRAAKVLEELDTGRPPVVALLLGERFYTPDDEACVTPGPGDANTDYHAVVAVGHGLDDRESYILVRNSWGPDWGLDGHAWIAASYLEPRLYALARLHSQGIV